MTISALSAATSACDTSGWSLSNLALQKLLYLAHRTYIGRHAGEALVDENFEAWDYGPVLPSLYRQARIFGSDIIDALPPVRRHVWRPEHEMIREVIQYHANRTPGQLVELTHQINGAWDRNYIPGVRHRVIPNADILDEYRMLRQLAA